MIVGRGRVAQALARTNNTGGAVYYANGKCHTANSDRELNEVLEYWNGHVVYFSSVTSSRELYLRHKRNVEDHVLAAGGIVFRLTNPIAPITDESATGTSWRRSNPGNVGYLDSCITWTAFDRKSSPFELHIDRNPIINLVDIDDVAKIVTDMVPKLDAGSLVEIVGPETTPLHLLVQIVAENYAGTDVAALIGDAAEDIKRKKLVDAPDLQRPAFNAAPYGVDFSDGYVHRVLKKYYGPFDQTEQ